MEKHWCREGVSGSTFRNFSFKLKLKREEKRQEYTASFFRVEMFRFRKYVGYTGRL
jgi:hypothetical protein